MAYDLLRQRMETMAEGVPLSPVPQLMRELGVSQATISRVYGLLESEGLIKRCPGKGVFVADRLAAGEFALVLQPKFLGPAASPYWRMASAALIEAMHERNPQWRLKMHVGRPDDRPEKFPGTLDLLEPEVIARLRGVFAFHPLYEVEAGLERAGVPLVGLGCEGARHRISFDYDDMFRRAVDHLAALPCGSIGLLWHNSPLPGVPDTRYDQTVAELARAGGLQWRAEWMLSRDGEVYERIGYEMFMRLWNLPRRPDAIIVDDEILCRGVLQAVLQLGVHLPEDIRLITQATPGVELPYHKRVSRIEFDPTEQVTRAVEMMLALLDGRQPGTAVEMLQSRIVEGETT